MSCRCASSNFRAHPAARPVVVVGPAVAADGDRGWEQGGGEGDAEQSGTATGDHRGLLCDRGCGREAGHVRNLRAHRAPVDRLVARANRRLSHQSKSRCGRTQRRAVEGPVQGADGAADSGGRQGAEPEHDPSHRGPEVVRALERTDHEIVTPGDAGERRLVDTSVEQQGDVQARRGWEHAAGDRQAGGEGGGQLPLAVPVDARRPSDVTVEVPVVDERRERLLGGGRRAPVDALAQGDHRRHDAGRHRPRSRSAMTARAPWRTSPRR